MTEEIEHRPNLTLEKLQKLIDKNELDNYINQNYDIDKYKDKYDIQDVVFSKKISIKTAKKLLSLKKFERSELLNDILSKFEYYKLIDNIFANAINTPDLITSIKLLITKFFEKHNEYNLNNFKEYIQYIMKLKE